MMIAQTIHLKPKVEYGGNLIILTLKDGNIREEENMLAKDLAGIMGEIGQHHLLLDFARMTYINSVELGTLIGLHQKIKRSGGRLTLFNLNDAIYEVFDVTGLHTVLEICREKALAT